MDDENPVKTLPELPPAPWDRQPRESVNQYYAFVSYRDQLSPRSLTKVWEKDGTRIPRAVAYVWYKEHEWDNRAAAYDAHLTKVMTEERIAQLRYGTKDLVERHMSVLKSALDITEAELDKLFVQVQSNPDFSVLKPQILLQLLEKTITLQRLVAGESTAKVEVEETYDFSGLDLDEVRKVREALLAAKVKK